MYWPETISNTRLHQATTPLPHLEKVDMAWSCQQDEQQPASKNSANLDTRRKQKKRQAENNVATNNGRRTEGCWIDMGHSSKESPRQRGLARSCAQQQGEPKTEGSGEILCTAARRAQDRGVWRDLVHSSKESPRPRGLARSCAQHQGEPKTEGFGKILCEPYVPHGMKRISK